MYIYVVVVDQKGYDENGPGSGHIKARLELASGEPCLIVPYRRFNMKLVEELKPRGIAMSGFGGHFEDRKVRWFWGMDEVLHQAEVPILCFCGSHQVLGFSYNQNLRKTKSLRDPIIRKLRPNEDFPRRATTDPKLKNRYLADGIFPIQQVRKDPLFKGLPKNLLMRCSHSCEVKKLPRDFELIASSAHCKIEGMRHKTKTLYGVQFHPEAFAAPYFHGRTLLENFADIVNDYWSKRS